MHTRSASKQGLELIPLDLELEKTTREKKKQTVISKHSPSKMDVRDLENNYRGNKFFKTLRMVREPC